MLLLRLPTLVSFVAACALPFNSFKYLGNDTHSTKDLIRNLVNQLPNDMGWTEIVTMIMIGQPRTTWPNSHVSYCFEDEAARTHFEDDIKKAWNLWTDAIGEAGTAHHHSLEFHEYSFAKDSFPYCYKKRTQSTDAWVWNADVPHDVAVIAGNPIQEKWSDEEGRHGAHLSLYWKGRYPPEYWVTTVAHELGHIFGFWHEHQREDRDEYVRFDCSKLGGYVAAKARVDADKKHTTDEVCNNYLLALDYEFTAIQDFDTIDHIDPIQKDDLDVDDESIMLYTSADHAGAGLDYNGVLQVPLAFWKKRGIGFQPPKDFTKNDLELIPVPWKVIEGDYEGVKYLYPS